MTSPSLVDRSEPWYATALGGVSQLGPTEATLVAAGGSGAFAVREHVAHIEQLVAQAPEDAFAFDGEGTATLRAGEHTYGAGRFTTPTLGELRARLEARLEARRAASAAALPESAPGRIRLSALTGTHPLTDIGALQASAPEGVLFQAASQFNCLEAPGPRIVRVRHYPSDPTQGPRASVSAFPATLLRHYRAPAKDGTRFEQTDERCINLLEDVFDPAVAEVQSGYLQSGNVHDPAALAESLERNFERARVGVHDDVEVVYGANWGGPVPGAPEHRIAQVFTSTLAQGGYGSDHGWEEIAAARRQLLRAAYLGTLLAAIDLRKHTVVLTLIGGGVFGNPKRDIRDAIHWAVAEAERYADGILDVVVNTRLDGDAVDRDEIERRGGALLSFEGDSLVVR